MSTTAASLRRNAKAAREAAARSGEAATTYRTMGEHLRRLDPAYKDEIIGAEIARLYGLAAEMERDAEAQTQRAERLERNAKTSDRRNTSLSESLADARAYTAREQAAREQAAR